MDSNTSDTIYQDYMRTSFIKQLRNRPIAFTAIPNYNVNEELEHRLFFVTSAGEIFNLSLSSYMNIRIQTKRIASRQIVLNLSSTFNLTKTIIIKINGNEAVGFWQTIKSITELLIVIGVSLAISLVMMFFISKDKHLTMLENKGILIRHSMKPIAGMIGKFMSRNVKDVQQEQEDLINLELDKEEDEYKSSDDSDEAEEKTRKLSLLPKGLTKSRARPTIETQPR